MTAPTAPTGGDLAALDAGVPGRATVTRPPAGAAAAGGTATGAGSTLRAPHGGLRVTPLIGGTVPRLFAVVAGALLTAVAGVVLEGLRSPGDVTEQEAVAAVP